MKSSKTVSKPASGAKHKIGKTFDNLKQHTKHSAADDELPVAIVIEKAREGGQKLPEHILGS